MVWHRVQHVRPTKFLLCQCFVALATFVIVSIVGLQYFYLRRHATISYESHKHLLRNVSSVIHRMVNSSRRFYLHDFEFNSLLEKWQKGGSSSVLYKPPDPTVFVSIDKVMFLVLGSVSTKNKSIALMDSWLSMARNFYIFADQNDSSIPNFITLPEIVGKPTREDAQHRQLRGMKWLWANNTKWTEFSWFVLADDDTWLNIPALLHFLSPYSEDLPVAFGYVWDNIWEPGRSHLSGGGGMVLSRTAFGRIAKHLYTPKVPFDRFNDLTISNGCEMLGIVKVHSDKFYWNRVSLIGIGQLQPFPPNYVGKISFHYMNSWELSLRMTCDVAIFWKFKMPPKCGNLTRFSDFLKVKSHNG